jgi:diguanylate cyclase (GGDEF)-like protein
MWDGDEVEAEFVRADGTTGWGLWRRSLVSGTDGDRYVLQCVDISQRKQAEGTLEFRAHHDVLTGLPNRTHFTRRLADRLAGGTGSGHVAVCFIDLDNFKVINDSLGHRAGDRLLTMAADRLADALRPSDVVGRFGGDEFTVLLADVEDEADALRVSERLVDVLRPPFVLDGEQRFLTASVGLTVTGDPGTEAEDMLRQADMAMYRAKELGKSQCALFDDWLRDRSIERLELEGGLRHALARDELRLLYQPEVALETGEIVAVEALLRWQHPEHGLISPAKFIPIAEQTGLIVPIGAWVVREACRVAAEWRREPGARDITMAVNLSPRQLGAVDLVDTVRDALADAELPPSCLCLEVTETALMNDMDTALAALGKLKELGVRLAIDDFGIGYSSLMHLKQLLPVDILKIDKAFVDGVLERAEDRAIVEAVVRLAGALGVDAIAEGVETAGQADALRALSCGYAQGFHFARPSTPSDVRALISSQASARA